MLQGVKGKSFRSSLVSPSKCRKSNKVYMQKPFFSRICLNKLELSIFVFVLQQYQLQCLVIFIEIMFSMLISLV